ncbi:helix-turn-helix transcriptional regulator [Aquimarina sp. U1-2]|uniref:helix-turn-helix domain-containing protein n=1 Tax=Aquimarina sp. U1-2 TaxID=2823141 RepID=UPI001AED050D|nr:helix-turn-helix transcriptional regulator [Aquimarina sp. U1-2]MBP2831847.1 helix-turn-helix transcriptional regulator [Aquimarina sp. U1-2]
MTNTTNQYCSSLTLDDFVQKLKGDHFFNHKYRFAGGLNGIYIDEIKEFSKTIAQLPQTYVQDFYVIYVLNSGRLSKITQNKRVHFETNTVGISLPGQMKSWKTIDNPHGYLIAFSKAYLSSLKYRKNMLLEFPFLLQGQYVDSRLSMDSDISFFQLMQKANANFETKDSISYELIRVEVLEILLHLKRHISKQTSMLSFISAHNSTLTHQFFEHLEDHFVSGIKANYVTNKSVHDFANALNVHQKVLCNQVKKSTGKSPKTIILDRYILAAQCKLVHTSMPISEIGYVLGYSNPSYFSRFFKKNTGVSPQEYREDFYAIT